jgi:hypothetical protein
MTDQSAEPVEPAADEAINRVPEPTDDSVADGTQIPTADDLPAEEGDAGVGDVELPDDVYAEGED